MDNDEQHCHKIQQVNSLTSLQGIHIMTRASMHTTQSHRVSFPACLLAVCLAFSGCVLRGDGGWREYKVFCGMSFKEGEVTEDDWRRFCDEHVTTAFPDGYTSFEATGYWRGGAATTARENARVLLIVAPADAKEKVLTIARQYREQFQQEAVLVVDAAGNAVFVEDGP